MLTRGRLLAGNTIWNLVSQFLPAAVGIVVLPALIRGLGVARFGVLSLAWIIIGYFNLLDLGIGRGLTAIVATKLGARDKAMIPPLVWTSLLLMGALGGVGGVAIWATSPWMVERVFKVPDALRSETLQAFYLLAASIPLVTITSVLRGILEAQQEFRIVSLIRIAVNIGTIAGPLLVLPYSRSLFPVIGILVATRVLGAVAHLYACFRTMPELRQVGVRLSLLPQLMSIGGWMSVSSVVGPLMVYIDRFLIGALLSVSAVAYYTAPFDIVIRVSGVSAAVAGVLFPAFALSLAQDPNRTRLLLRRGVTYVFLATFPMVMVMVTVAPEGLRIWLGDAFAQHSAVVLRWLAAGIFVNGLAYMPFSLVQSAGRPDLTAKLHLVELPIYLVGLRVLVGARGIEGAAIAWTVRAILDGLATFLFAQRLLPQGPRFSRALGVATAAALLVLYVTTLPKTLGVKLLWLSIGLAVFGSVSWWLVLTREERAFVVGIRPGLLGRGSGLG